MLSIVVESRRLALAFTLCAALSGCAGYRLLPLGSEPRLAASLAELDRALPPGAGVPGTTIALDKPLGIDAIGLLAILNDPELRSERGTMGVAQAGLVQASLLPNPMAGLGYAALLGGPGTTDAYTASLSEDIAALVTYRARVNSAQAHLAEVNAELLWQEWQVAQKSRLLALDIASADQVIALDRRELRLVTDEVETVRAATAAGNLDLSALAPLLAAEASVEQSLAAATLEQLKNWQALDALLGLSPDVRFAIAPPEFAAAPPDPAPLIASLPQRRPDLVALQLGYRSSEENLRAAVLGQFPAFALGGSWSQDSSNVRSAGPTASFELPIFNRNQGKIAEAKATRLVLHDEYQARLDSAAAEARGLAAQLQKLSADLAAARRGADSATALSRAARAAYAQGNIDQRSLIDYETTALQRASEVIALERSFGEDRILLTVALGLGLPQIRIVPPSEVEPS